MTTLSCFNDYIDRLLTCYSFGPYRCQVERERSIGLRYQTGTNTSPFADNLPPNLRGLDGKVLPTCWSLPCSTRHNSRPSRTADWLPIRLLRTRTSILSEILVYAWTCIRLDLAPFASRWTVCTSSYRPRDWKRPVYQTSALPPSDDVYGFINGDW